MRIDLDPALAGLLVPDPALTGAGILEDDGTLAGSSYTEAGPIPGRAVYQRGAIAYSSTTPGTRGPHLRLTLSGEQAEDHLLRVSRAGMPGDGCEVTRGRPGVGDDPEQWWGWHPPTILETVAADLQIDRGQDLPGNWCAVENGDGRVVIAWSNAGVIEAIVYDPATHDQDGPGVTIADSTRQPTEDGATPGGVDVMDMVRLPSGRLYLASLVTDEVDGYQLAAHYSDDAGLTWRSLTLHALDVPVSASTDPTRICLAVSRERVLLLVHGTHDDGQSGTMGGWRQYASSDLGASYTLVEDWSTQTATAAGPPAVTVDAATGILTVIDAPATGTPACIVQIRRIESPYLPLLSVAPTTIGSAVATPSSEVRAWVDSTGDQWAVWGPVAGALIAARSLDGGATWTEQSGQPIALRTAGGVPDRYSVHPVRDRVIWLLADTASTTRTAQDLLVVEAGGWTQLPQPRVTGGYPYELLAWGGGLSSVWLPLDHPTQYGWTGGSGSMAIGSTWGLRHTSPGYHSRTVGSVSPWDGIIVHAEVEVTIGGGVASSEIGIRIELSDGSEDIRADVRMSVDTIAIYDLTAASTVASASQPLTSRTAIRIAMRHSSGIAVYARPLDSDLWTLVVAGTLTRRTVGAVASTMIRWGHLGSMTLDSRWTALWVAVGGSSSVSTHPALGQMLTESPDDLPGARLPSAPGRLHLAGGCYVEGRSGPGLRGDLWRLELGHRYPVAALVSRSPRAPWRSTSTALHRIAWAPADGLTHHPGGLALGLAVVGCLSRRVQAAGWTGTAWEVVGELDLATGTTALEYIRDGDTLRPAPGARGPYLRASDVAGAGLDLGGGVLRRVASATSGAWTSSTATASLRIAGADGTEPSSGTMVLWRTSGAVAILGELTGYSRWALVVPSQATPEGYHQIGRAVLGTLHILGQRPSLGRRIDYEARVETVEGGGLTAARQVAPLRRVVSLAWVEGVPTVGTWGEEPDHQQAGGGPVAAIGDTSIIDALQGSHGGGVGELVYLPRIAHDPDAEDVEQVACVGRELVVYGELQGDPSVEDIAGDEAVDSVQRVAGIVIRELS